MSSETEFISYSPANDDQPAIRFNASNITFGNPSAMKNGAGYRIPVKCFGNVDGKSIEGPLLLLTPLLTSYGVTPKKPFGSSPDDPTISGYQLPLLLYGIDAPSEEETIFVKTLEAITNVCKSHLLANKTKVKRGELEASDLRKMSPIFIKKDENGIPMKDKTPTLYVNLMTSNSNGELIITTPCWYSSGPKAGQEYDPYSLLGTRCKVQALIKVESILVTNSYKVQLKIQEVLVQPPRTSVSLIRPRVSQVHQEEYEEEEQPSREPQDEEEPVEPNPVEESTIPDESFQPVQQVESPPKVVPAKKGGRRKLVS